MKGLLLKLYSAYGLVVFGLTFLVLLPFFLLAIFIPPWEKMAAVLNHIWARVFFFMLFLNRTKKIGEAKLDRKQRYVFCANHTSFLDIPTMGLISHNFKFIGKQSLAKVPLWGFMYSKLHILVDRASLKSRHNSWLKAQEAIRKGFSIVFFPEGGILTKEPPKMVAFKEGAFRIAVNEQIPIVPVTIPFNHILLPDQMPLTMHPGKVIMKMHQPIWPMGTDDEAVKALKNEVRTVIEQELNNFHEHR
jgi:1-acyl-sn-glycerol-3-phosphate acyltransferase